MSQRQWIVLSGVWVMVFLFLGIPATWEKILAILTGLFIIVIAYRIRFNSLQKPADSFSESLSVKKVPDQPTTTNYVSNTDNHAE
ncbi:MAG: hypothetical protein KGJ35_02605 [Patescibacteria group bacterium]|nr:hypothetical protein [Patescibacteria group bacterium]